MRYASTVIISQMAPTGKKGKIMDERMQLAQKAQLVIQQELRDRAETGNPVGVVFLPNELLYAMKAMPNTALKYTHQDGETIYDVPVIRFESDDMSLYFLASAHYSDGRPGVPEFHHRPYYYNPKEVTNYGING